MFKTVGDHMGMIDSALLIEIYRGVVLTDDNCKITGWVKEDLISEDARNRFHWYWFAVTSQLGKRLFFTDTVGVPRHKNQLH